MTQKNILGAIHQWAEVTGLEIEKRGRERRLEKSQWIWSVIHQIVGIIKMNSTMYVLPKYFDPLTPK